MTLFPRLQKNEDLFGFCEAMFRGIEVNNFHLRRFIHNPAMISSTRANLRGQASSLQAVLTALIERS